MCQSIEVPQRFSQGIWKTMYSQYSRRKYSTSGFFGGEMFYPATLGAKNYPPSFETPEVNRIRRITGSLLNAIWRWPKAKAIQFSRAEGRTLNRDLYEGANLPQCLMMYSGILLLGHIQLWNLWHTATSDIYSYGILIYLERTFITSSYYHKLYEMHYFMCFIVTDVIQYLCQALLLILHENYATIITIWIWME